METKASQYFEMKNSILSYDTDKSILLCKNNDNDSKRWIKKIKNTRSIEDIIEDNDKFYIRCESYDINGYYLALNKKHGNTEWYIPGKAFFQIIFDGFLYLIFADNDKLFYLLKIDRSNGSKLWYHQIAEDLRDYRFRTDRILLSYHSGNQEKISPRSGARIP